MKSHQPIKLGGKARTIRYLKGLRGILNLFSFLARCRKE